MKLRNLTVAFVVGIELLQAQNDVNEAGKKMERAACVACHSVRIIESQRLSAAAWEKEVDKMIGWGAVVPERKMLIDYLAAEYGHAKPAPAPEISKSGVSH